MIDHIRTEKIGGDSIYFCGHPSQAGNRYDSLATLLGIRESDQYFVICCLFVVICMLSLSIMSICVVIMDIFLISILCLIIVVFICGLDYEWIW